MILTFDLSQHEGQKYFKIVRLGDGDVEGREIWNACGGNTILSEKVGWKMVLLGVKPGQTSW